MDPVVAASIELAMALPANDSILDTLSTEMLAVMLCASSHSVRPHVAVLQGHDDRSLARHDLRPRPPEDGDGTDLFCESPTTKK
jgi:hypothetical protein